MRFSVSVFSFLVASLVVFFQPLVFGAEKGWSGTVTLQASSSEEENLDRDAIPPFEKEKYHSEMASAYSGEIKVLPGQQDELQAQVVSKFTLKTTQDLSGRPDCRKTVFDPPLYKPIKENRTDVVTNQANGVADASVYVSFDSSDEGATVPYEIGLSIAQVAGTSTVRTTSRTSGGCDPKEPVDSTLSGDWASPGQEWTVKSVTSADNRNKLQGSQTIAGVTITWDLEYVAPDCEFYRKEVKRLSEILEKKSMEVSTQRDVLRSERGGVIAEISSASGNGTLDSSFASVASARIETGGVMLDLVGGQDGAEFFENLNTYFESPTAMEAESMLSIVTQMSPLPFSIIYATQLRDLKISMLHGLSDAKQLRQAQTRLTECEAE